MSILTTQILEKSIYFYIVQFKKKSDCKKTQIVR